MKKTLFGLLIIILAISSIGCSKSDLESYNNAVLETNDIKKGQKSFDINIDYDFVQDGLTDEELKELNNFKNIKMSSFLTYDSNQEKAISINYTQLGGLGLDSVLYIDKDKQYLQLSTYWKYLLLNKDVDTNDSMEEDTIEIIKSKWIEILNEKDVLSGEKILLSTEDGEVKAREYTIKLNEEQLKGFLNFVLDTIEGDLKFKEFSKQMIIGVNKDFADKDKENIVTDLIKNLKISIKDAKELNLRYIAYIDIDDYIVEENINFILDKETNKKGDVKKATASIVIKNWDIEKEQNLEFQPITPENSIKVEDVDWENIFR